MTALETILVEDAKKLARETLRAGGRNPSVEIEDALGAIVLGCHRGATPEQLAALEATPVEVVRAGSLAALKSYMVKCGAELAMGAR